MPLEMREMSLDDLQLALSWAAGEGWNPGVDDAMPFLAADPAGFLMGYLDGEPAVSISAVRYADRYAFIGLYITRPELRGRALGAEILRLALDRVADVTAGADGVLDRVENYKRLGFRPSHGNLRFAGLIPADADQRPGIVAIDAGLIEAVAAFDSEAFGVERTAFTRQWLAPTASRTGLALIRDGEVAGYGVIRDCGIGHKIGPLFAEAPADAETILLALAATRPGGKIFWDVPTTNIEARTMAEAFGLEVAFETVRMYRGGAFAPDMALTYGVTTLELG